jgi:ABC-type uncharacterized transport system ATPase subunit
MDATRLESVTTSCDSITAVSGVALRVRHGAILGLFGPNVAAKTTTAQMIMDPPAGAGGTEPSIFRTRSRKCRHNGRDYDRDAQQRLLHRSIHPPQVRSREGVRFNLTERQEPQHSGMANCVLSSNPTVRVCCIEFTSVARLGNGVEAEPKPGANGQKTPKERMNTSLGSRFSNGR